MFFAATGSNGQKAFFITKLTEHILLGAEKIYYAETMSCTNVENIFCNL